MPTIVKGDAYLRRSAALGPGGWVGDRPWRSMLPFSEGLATVQGGGYLWDKWGVIDVQGNTLCPPTQQYDWVSECSEGLMAAKGSSIFGGENHGFIKPDGTTGVIPFKREWTGVGVFARGLAPVKVGDRWGYIDKGGEFAIPLAYEEAYAFQEGGLAIVKQNGMYGCIDTNGVERIPAQWAGMGAFAEGRAYVQQVPDGPYGYIDHEGKLTIPLQFQQASPFSEGFADVLRHGTWILIDKFGKALNTVQGEELWAPVRGLVKFRQGKYYGLSRVDGQIVEPAKWENIIHQQGCYTVVQEAKSGDWAVEIPKYAIRFDSGELSPFRPFPLAQIQFSKIDNNRWVQVPGRKRTSYTPFAISPEFASSEAHAPPFRTPAVKTYDKAFLIAWSGMTDNEFYVEAVNQAARTFVERGVEVHTFLPGKDDSVYSDRYPIAYGKQLKGVTRHDARTSELHALVDSIQSMQRSGLSISVTFFFTNHGTFYQDHFHAVVGGMGGAKEVGIYEDNLETFAHSLAGVDVRFINGVCYGANIDDVFFEHYLNARSKKRVGGDFYSCSSTLSGWTSESIIFGPRSWESSFVADATLTFLQASFRAGREHRLGEVTSKRESGRPNAFWNASMTSSERMLYLGRLARDGKLKASQLAAGNRVAGNLALHHRGPEQDELSEEFFSLSSPSIRLTLPNDSHFRWLFEESKSQTEQFLKSLDLNETTKARLGIDAASRIDFERAKLAMKDGVIISLKEKNIEWHEPFYKVERLGKIGRSRFVWDGKRMDSPDEFQKWVELPEHLYVSKRQSAIDEVRRLLDSEEHKQQVALILIKRLALMLDFLNDPHVLQKRKDLFAWYRAAELGPLIPVIRSVPSSSDIGR